MTGEAAKPTHSPSYTANVRATCAGLKRSCPPRFSRLQAEIEGVSSAITELKELSTDNEADTEAEGVPKKDKKRETVKGKKWRDIIAKKTLKKRDGESLQTADEGEEANVQGMERLALKVEGGAVSKEKLESSLEVFLKAPTSQDSKSKKWKDRLEKKRMEKEGGEKVWAEEKAVDKKKNVKVELKPKIESAVDMEEDLNSPASHDCKSKKWKERIAKKRLSKIEKNVCRKVEEESSLEAKEERRLQTSQAVSSSKEKEVNKFRDQLRSSFVTFDAVLNTKQAISKDDASVWTEFTDYAV